MPAQKTNALQDKAINFIKDFFYNETPLTEKECVNMLEKYSDIWANDASLTISAFSEVLFAWHDVVHGNKRSFPALPDVSSHRRKAGVVKIEESNVIDTWGMTQNFRQEEIYVTYLRIYVTEIYQDAQKKIVQYYCSIDAKERIRTVDLNAEIKK